MEKRRIGPVPGLCPVPIILAGAMDHGRANSTTVRDCAIMGTRPALAAVSLGEGHFTTRRVVDHRAFSINVPTTAQLAAADYLGTISGRDVDMSKPVAWRLGATLPVPLVDDCPVNLECRVLQDGTVEHRHFFVAEVLEVHLREGVGPGSTSEPVIPDLRTLDPILYFLGNRCYCVGEPIGTGYAEASRASRGEPPAGE
jgi:flavin reductase (DIM6/NTAB) family NADH-FMN oxidoreductase RutF